MARSDLRKAGVARFRTEQGGLLRQARLACGKSSAQVADEIGTQQSQLSRWERGAQLVRVDWLARLARCYGVGPADLMPPTDVLDEKTEDQTDGTEATGT